MQKRPQRSYWTIYVSDMHFGSSVWYGTCFFIMLCILSWFLPPEFFCSLWLQSVAWRCLWGWESCRYITSEDVLESKGNVACLISTADELTLTELMFNGTFEKIKVEELVSLLSCFVWQEKLQDTQKPREELELLFAQLQDTARRVAKVQLESKVCIIWIIMLIKLDNYGIKYNSWMNMSLGYYLTFSFSDSIKHFLRYQWFELVTWV